MNIGARVRAVRPMPARAVRAVHPARPALAAVLWLVFLGNGGVIVWLWLHGGGVSAIHRPADLMTSIGRITGLLGAYLLLIQVLLIARVRWVERLGGFDRLTVWHRRNGKLCLYLVLAHVVFITAGYTLTDRLSLWSEVRTLLTQYPGMVTATFGTALLILTVMTSIVIVRRRLRYETWYLVHLSAYAGLVLGWFHQIPTGNELSVSHAAATYWTLLYLATLALLVLFRLLWPAVMMYRHRLRVIGVTIDGPNVVSLRIGGRHLDRLGARAGQFFLWRFFTRDRWWESHPFSLSEAPDGWTFRITMKALGDFTARAGGIAPGTLVLAEGPFGVFTRDAQRRDRVALIAGGIGITPIRALMQDLDGDVVLLYRVVLEEDLIFRDEIEQLARDRGFRFHFVVGDHGSPEGRFLLSPDHLIRLVPDIAERDVFVCGPPAMTQVLENNVRRSGVPRRHIHVERFALS